MALEIPLTSAPDAVFNVDLEARAYRFRIHWNQTAGVYLLSLEGEGAHIRGMALVAGYNLLAPHAVVGLGALVLVDSKAVNADPNYSDLGARHRLIYLTREELGNG